MKLPYETDGGIGKRATLGVIVLESDETIEPEFAQMTAMRDVALYTSRIPMVSAVRPETLRDMLEALPASAALFPSALDFDVIGYGCTSASSVIGTGKVAQAIKSIYPNTEVTDPLAAIIAACTTLNVKNLGFLTPYIPDVSKKMHEKLEEAGFSIKSFGSFEEENDQVVARITEQSIFSAAEKIAQAAPCDALVISCTNLRCLKVIPKLERRTKIPVISSNQALAWHMLRLAGVNTPRRQFGQLFCCKA